MDKIGLFGGSFDPIHEGHIAIAAAACEQKELQRLYFIPAKQSPLKQEPTAASDAHRLAMIESVLTQHPCFAVDDVELQRGGVSYSLDTVDYFLHEYAGSELFWVLGADQVQLLPRWRNIDSLAKKVTFLAFGRERFSEKTQQEDQALPVQWLELPQIDISSSQIRQDLQGGKSVGEEIAAQLPQSVHQYIIDHGLYSPPKLIE